MLAIIIIKMLNKLLLKVMFEDAVEIGGTCTISVLVQQNIQGNMTNCVTKSRCFVLFVESEVKETVKTLKQCTIF